MLFIYNIKFIYLLSKYEEENVNCKVTQWGFLIFFYSLGFTGAWKNIIWTTKITGYLKRTKMNACRSCKSLQKTGHFTLAIPTINFYMKKTFQYDKKSIQTRRNRKTSFHCINLKRNKKLHLLYISRGTLWSCWWTYCCIILHITLVILIFFYSN